MNTSLEMQPRLTDIRVVDFGYYIASQQDVQSGQTEITTQSEISARIENCKKLIKSADVLIENFRPGVMARLGLGHEEAMHPSGWGTRCRSLETIPRGFIGDWVFG